MYKKNFKLKITKNFLYKGIYNNPIDQFLTTIKLSYKKLKFISKIILQTNLNSNYKNLHSYISTGIFKHVNWFF